MATKSIKDYAMNPQDHSYLPAFPDTADPGKAIIAYNKILVAKVNYQKACADAESKMYAKIQEIFKDNGIQ